MATISKRYDREGNLIGFQARVRKRGQRALVQTFRHRADAKRWAAGIETDIERGALTSGLVEAGRTTLAEALDRYAHSATVAQLKTAEAVRQDCVRLARNPLAAMYLASIRSADIAKFRDERRAQVRANTVRLDLALISRVFNIARKEWGMESLHNPCELVERPRLPPGRNRRLVGDEEERLLAECFRSKNPWLEGVTIVALDMAMRRGEILAMRWDDVVLGPNESRYLGRCTYLEDSKNGEGRGVPLLGRVPEILRRLPRSIDGRVFPMSDEGIRQAWDAARNRAGLHNFKFHDLRHEAISRLIAQGLPWPMVRAVSGHKSAQASLRYIHPKAEEIIAKLEDLQARNGAAK